MPILIETKRAPLRQLNERNLLRPSSCHHDIQQCALGNAVHVNGDVTSKKRQIHFHNFEEKCIFLYKHIGMFFFSAEVIRIRNVNSLGRYLYPGVP